MEKMKEKYKKDILNINQKLKEFDFGNGDGEEDLNDIKNRRKNAYLNENNLMNYGDIKNKRIYLQYYKEINEEGINDDEDFGEANVTLTTKKKNIDNSKEEEGISSEEDLKRRKKDINNTKQKGEKKGKNNYITEDDKNSEEKEEEIKEVEEFNKKNKIKIENLKHSLQISNENL